MPFITINDSPLIPSTSPVTIYYRETGGGMPLVFLHGGWGYEVYPFDRQIQEFGGEFSILIPDRTGYGRSMRIDDLPADFHHRAAVEMLKFLDALGIERAVLWGHSDGAVISVLMGLAAPDRFAGIILEAFHYYKDKPGSAGFFDTMAKDPNLLGERITSVLSKDHGEGYWQRLIINNGYAWLRVAESSEHPKEDLYDGKIGQLKTPTILIHGSRDPRTEPDELDELRRAFPQSKIHLVEGGGHSPHSERAVAEEVNRIASEFLRSIRQQESGASKK